MQTERVEGVPTPQEIKAMRARAGLTQTEAGWQVYAPLRTWQRWECGESAIPEATWELFLIKIERML